MFEPGDIDAMGRWAAAQPSPTAARSADSIANRQATYWSHVSSEASRVLERYSSSRRFPALDAAAVTRCLEAAVAPAAAERRSTEP